MKKTSHKKTARPHEPHESEIRDYAYHLYVQGGCHPGHDLDNWLEAKACILANIPKEHSRFRLHHQIQAASPELRAVWRLAEPAAAAPAN
jgi:hypothetical protein